MHNFTGILLVEESIFFNLFVMTMVEIGHWTFHPEICFLHLILLVNCLSLFINFYKRYSLLIAKTQNCYKGNLYIVTFPRTPNHFPWKTDRVFICEHHRACSFVLHIDNSSSGYMHAECHLSCPRFMSKNTIGMVR